MNDILKIENYQIIKKGDITFRPGITLITGPSNNGKSSIFKAFKQIIYNLSGNTYINQFADKCTLTLSNDKYKIIYNKWKSKSSYDITEFYPDDYENKIHIDKLGVNQIDKIKELTKIDKDLGYNFWDQLEKPFLISRTNREQFLLLQESPISGSLINIQENIKADIKSLKDDLLVNQGSLNIINEDIIKYEAILKYSGEVNTLSDAIKKLIETNSKIININKHQTSLDTVETELCKLKDLSDITINTDSIKDLFEKYNYFNTQIANITAVNSQIVGWDQCINNTIKEIEAIDNIINTKFNICPLCGNILPHN